MGGRNAKKIGIKLVSDVLKTGAALPLRSSLFGGVLGGLGFVAGPVGAWLAVNLHQLN